MSWICVTYNTLTWYYVLKTSWRFLEVVFKMSWRRLEDVLKTILQDVLKTSWKRLQDILARHLEEVLKASWRRLEDVWPGRIYWSSSRRLQDVFWRRKAKANIFVLIRTSSKTSSEDEDQRRLHIDECLLGLFLLFL